MITNIFRALYSVYFILITIFFFVVYTIPITFMYPFWGKKKHYNYAVWGKIWAQSILFATCLYPKISGNFPKKGSSNIFVLNHQSQIDILIALAVLPAGFIFIAKEDLFKVPFLGMSMKKCGYIPIKRESPKESTKTLEKIKQLVQEGKSVLIFPEGTRSTTGKIGAVKRGSIMLAFDTKTALLPVVLNPAYKIMPKGSLFLHHQPLKVIFGAPIHFDWENKNRNYTIHAAKKVEEELNVLMNKIL